MRWALLLLLLGCDEPRAVGGDWPDAAPSFDVVWCEGESIHCASRARPGGPWDLGDDAWAPTCDGHPYLADYPEAGWDEPRCIRVRPVGESNGVVVKCGPDVLSDGFAHCVPRSAP